MPGFGSKLQLTLWSRLGSRPIQDDRLVVIEAPRSDSGRPAAIGNGTALLAVPEELFQD